MGHTYGTVDGRPVRLSGKSLALLTYLALEGRPQHRDHLADLLWESSSALKNLRVELSRLRQRGLDLFPPAQPMLDLKVATDLEEWLGRGEELDEAQHTAWLSASAGVPLSGLDDVGSPAFHAWVDARRAVITQVVDERLSRSHAHLLAVGDPHHTLVEMVLRRRGVPLQSPRTVASQALSVPIFDRPEVRLRLMDVLRRAVQFPQLVIVEDRAGSDVRDLLALVAAQTDWQLLEMKAPAEADLIAPVLQRQLSLLTASERTLGRPESPTLTGSAGDLLQAWARLSASGHRVVVAIHVGGPLAAAVVRSLHYAMNLPGGLTVVLCCALNAGGTLQHDLAAFDQGRVHRMPIPPLGLGAILKEVSRLDLPLGAEQRLSRAIVIAQESEGWGLYARSLLSRTADTGGHVTQPGEVRDALLAEVAALEPPFRTALSQLATVHSPFDEHMAGVVIGQEGLAILGEAEGRGLLVTAAAEELVRMPQLRYKSRDQDNQLTLAFEPLRAALSGALTGTERRTLRDRLARVHLDSRPDAALALYYAQRAGRTELADLARERLSSGVSGVVMSLPDPALLSGHQTHLGTAESQRREVRTGNGYRVVLEDSHLQVLRYGVHSRAPLLRLRWPHLPAGEWQFLGRVDVFREAVELGRTDTAFAFALQFPDQPLAIYSPEDVWLPPGTVARPPGSRVTVGRWFRVSGRSGGGPVELQVRALDVALTVALWHGGGQTLVPLSGAPILVP